MNASRLPAVSLLALAGLTACASRGIDAQWFDPQLAAGTPLRGARVLVVCEAPEEVLARICLDHLKADLLARGFQGVVKRHGFHGGPNTHGNTKHRKPGSISPGTDPSRVIKGKKMPGHYGTDRHTQVNLRVEKIDTARHLIYIRGAIAGPTNGIVLVRKQG